MQIKRFEAKNMTSALRMIKDELGPDAVILSARSLRKGKGFFGSLKYAGVEVSAAIDYQISPTESRNFRRSQDTYPDWRKTPNAVAGRMENALASAPPDYSTNGSAYRQRFDSTSNFEPEKKGKALSSLYQQILAQEVDRSIASELIEELKQSSVALKSPVEGKLRTLFGSVMGDMGAAADPNVSVEKSLNVAAFVGPTGVGKTLTIAKLAALQVSRFNKQVALISVDNYSIAATEQLKTYARILGIPLETAVNTAELKRAIRKFKDHDSILIDTPGINYKDRDSIQELAAFFGATDSLRIHLVLSAATKEKDLSAAIEAFREMGVHRLLFTKTDESSTFGNILNVLIKSSLPLSYLCCGRKVPDDIAAGSIEALVDLLFSSENSENIRTAATGPVNQPNGRRHFLANKNSDVYHRFDCKWSKRIKSENIVVFASAQMAEAQNFLPCSSCKPDRPQDVIPSDATGKLQQSGYR